MFIAQHQRAVAAASTSTLCSTLRSMSTQAPQPPPPTNSNNSSTMQQAATSTGTTPKAPSSPLPYPIILQHFLHAYNDGNKDVIEPFLHHNFVFEQAPVMPIQPKMNSVFKFDFLKRLPESRSAFSSRTVEVSKMLIQGNVVVVESKAVAVLAVDVPKLAKKGEKIEVFATTWFEFDPATHTILKMKSFDCVSAP
jgi:hypothetical protein